ncbi:hypothetical protein [Acanthopleuribacter pedis]|uniref:Uncharacterized protein n=1 Tax=Acanthopleuribacter pedis TaxID=442870 RepID=A0A8J7Q549_9BACT|nr:hypothetical protein [Acanthopleuribacter pedis]MBO1318297.1 hypothetical protein [Acanthopleuribacter pedis]
MKQIVQKQLHNINQPNKYHSKSNENIDHHLLFQFRFTINPPPDLSSQPFKYAIYFQENLHFREFILDYSNKKPNLNVALSNERMFEQVIRDQSELLKIKLLHHQKIVCLGEDLSRFGALPIPVSALLRFISE